MGRGEPHEGRNIDREPHKLCGAKTRAGGKCKQLALANGRCHFHGGKSTGSPPKHGLYSIKRTELARDYQKFLESPDPLNLAHELAVLRGLFEQFMNRYEDGVPLKAQDVAIIAKLAQEIGTMAERMSRMLNSTALTAAHVDVLRAIVAAIIVDFVPEERREDAVSRLRAAFTVD